MRVAVLSDIHGNAVALDACIEDLRSRGGADALVVAGDLCMDGPRPKQVLQRLRDLRAECVRGNTDRMIGVEPLAAMDFDDARAAQWTRDQIGRRWTRWLGDLPRTLTFGGADGLLVCHANPRSDDEHVWPDADDTTLERFFAGVEQQAIVFGHLHLAYTRLWRGKLLVNVASAGLPKDGDPHAHYAILTRRTSGWEVQERRVRYDVERVKRQLRRSGIPDLSKRLKTLERHRYPKLGEPGALIP